MPRTAPDPLTAAIDQLLDALADPRGPLASPSSWLHRDDDGTPPKRAFRMPEGRRHVVDLAAGG